MPRFLRRIDSFLFPSRLAILREFFAAFLVVNAIVRLGLAAFNAEPSFFLPWRLLPAMAIGAVFDLGAATFVAAPLAALLAWWPERYPGALKAVLAAMFFLLSAVMVFVGASELVFWNEFASRFNFIAVDYLVYTNEVVGNIRESYNMPLLLSLVGGVSALVWWAMFRRVAPLVAAPPSTLGTRSRAVALWALAPFLVFAVLDARYKEFSADAQLNELAGDGYFDFFHAFRANELDYERFYRTLPPERAARILAGELGAAQPAAADPKPPFGRDIRGRGPEKRLNVVLISVEALSADFMAAFGSREALTPRLDGLAREGLRSPICTRPATARCAAWRRSRYRCRPRPASPSSSARATNSSSRSGASSRTAASTAPSSTAATATSTTSTTSSRTTTTAWLIGLR
jgi:hypothetical protein